jgi:hypothetical protein
VHFPLLDYTFNDSNKLLSTATHEHNRYEKFDHKKLDAENLDLKNLELKLALKISTSKIE